MGGMCVRDEEKEVKFAMVSSTVVCVCVMEKSFMVKEKKKKKRTLEMAKRVCKGSKKRIIQGRERGEEAENAGKIRFRRFDEINV